MKILSSWRIRPGCVKEAVGRYMSGEGAPIAGVTVLGRWYKTDGSIAWAVYETDNPALLFEQAAKWADVLDVDHSLVVEDAEIMPGLKRVFGK